MTRSLCIFLTLVLTASANPQQWRIAWDIGTSGGAAPVVSTVPTNGLVSYWSMRSSGTTVYDEISTNTGTTVGSPQFGADYGVRNDGMDLNGSSYVNTIDSVLLNGLSNATIAAWVKVRTYTADDGIVAMRGAQHDPVTGLLLPTTSTLGSISFYGNNSTVTSSSNSVPTNVWTHVVGIYVKDSPLKIYINGIDDSAFGYNGGGSPSTPTGTISQNDVFRIGWDDGYSGRKFIGSIDEAAIWNRALSSNEIYQIYSTPLYYP